MGCPGPVLFAKCLSPRESVWLMISLSRVATLPIECIEWLTARPSIYFPSELYASHLLFVDHPIYLDLFTFLSVILYSKFAFCLIFASLSLPPHSAPQCSTASLFHRSNLLNWYRFSPLFRFHTLPLSISVALLCPPNSLNRVPT